MLYLGEAQLQWLKPHLTVSQAIIATDSVLLSYSVYHCPTVLLFYFLAVLPSLCPTVAAHCPFVLLSATVRLTASSTFLPLCHTVSLRSYSLASVLLSYCSTFLLSYCSLSYCLTVRAYCLAVLLSYCLLSCCPTVSLPYCLTVSLSYCFGESYCLAVFLLSLIIAVLLRNVLYTTHYIILIQIFIANVILVLSAI